MTGAYLSFAESRGPHEAHAVGEADHADGLLGAGGLEAAAGHQCCHQPRQQLLRYTNFPAGWYAAQHRDRPRHHTFFLCRICNQPIASK